MERLNDRIGAGVRWLALLMVLLGAYNAIARYLTRWAGVSLSSNALNEAQWYLFSVIFLLGAAYGLRVDAHVRVDVLYSRVSARMRGWIDLIGTLLFLLPFTVVMLWVSWPTVRNSFAIREASPDPGGLPRWPIKALILVSFALLLVQGVAFAVRAVERIRGTGEGGGGEGDEASGHTSPPGGEPPHLEVDPGPGATP